MAGKSREIKGRMKAVGNIQRITKTMQMIASARFQALQRRATEAQLFTRKIGEMVGELSAALRADGGDGKKQVSHPLLNAPEPATGRELVLVITSNRGLCGAYNGNVLRAASAYLRERNNPEDDIELVGRKGIAYCKFNDIPIAQTHLMDDSPSFDEVNRLAVRYMDDFAARKYDAVKVIYMAFESMSKQAPKVLQLLPAEDPTAKADAGTGPSDAASRWTGGNGVMYDYLPEPAELLSEMLPITVKTTLFQAFNEAVVSEQLARMVAMKAATDAAAKMGKSLSREYNRARQTAITTELSEIIGGKVALE